MSKYKTPKVYVKEVNSFPVSVSQGNATVPVFIGCTEQGEQGKAVRISSMLEYEQIFGGACTYAIGVMVKEKDKKLVIQSIGPENNVGAELEPRFYLYYQVKMYFDNGGGVCYVISAGDYSDNNPNKDQINSAIDGIGKEDEPTIILLPDSVLLPEADCYNTYKKALLQCDNLKDKFVVVDVLQGSDGLEDDIKSFQYEIGEDSLKYAASYAPYLNTTLNLAYDTNKIVVIKEDIFTSVNYLSQILLNTEQIPETLDESYGKTDYNNYVAYVEDLETKKAYDELGAILGNISCAASATTKGDYQGAEDAKDKLLPLIYADEYVSQEVIKLVEDIQSDFGVISEEIVSFYKYITNEDNVPDPGDPVNTVKNKKHKGANGETSEVYKKYEEYVVGLKATSYSNLTTILRNIKLAALCSNQQEYEDKGGTDADSLIPLLDLTKDQKDQSGNIVTEEIGGSSEGITNQINGVSSSVTELVNYLTETNVIPLTLSKVYGNAEYTTYKDYIDDLENFCKECSYNSLVSRVSIIKKAATSGKYYDGKDKEKLKPLMYASDQVRKNVQDRSNEVLDKVMPLEKSASQIFHSVTSYLDKIKIVLPPSGAITGSYARVDSQRGVWQAPANVSLNNVVSPTVRITDDDQARMNVPDNGKAVNAIRSFTGKGIMVWGARTLDANSNDWRYVNVRRLFNMVEKAVKNSCGVYLFQPNRQMTWTKITATINNYLQSLWTEGALVGSTPSEAYFVDVGLRKTMTPQDVLEGRMIVQVGLAAVRPAEFIIIEFSQLLQQS